MRSAILAFMALFGLLATLSVVQAAVPTTGAFSTSTAIENLPPLADADISYDAYGNQYFLRRDNDAAANVLVAANAAGALYTGCPVPASNAYTAFHTAHPGSTVVGLTYLANQPFPATLSAHWLFITTCAGASCKLLRLTVKTPTSTLPLTDCPFDVTGANLVVVGAPLGDISGTFAATNHAAVPFAANSLVTMTANPATGAIYIAAASSVGGTNSFVFRTPGQEKTADAFNGNFLAGTYTIFRIGLTNSRIGSMAVDTFGTLWVVDSNLFTVHVATAAATSLILPSAVSSFLGGAADWTKSSFFASNKFYAVTADRSGTVYFSTFTATGSGTNGYILSIPASALISSTTTTLPLPWAYFSGASPSFFENGNLAAGPIVYDPYRGRMIISQPFKWYNIALYTAQFDFTTLPTTLFDANGLTCPTEGPTCVRVPVVNSGVATSFSVRIVAPSWPAGVSLPVVVSFPTGNGFSSTNAPFASPVTSTLFAGSNTQIGTTGSFIYTNTQTATITSTGFAGFLSINTAFSGAADSVRWLFTPVPTLVVVVQGSITATPQASAAGTFPLSSTGEPLAGLPTRYALGLSPAAISGCTPDSIKFPNNDPNNKFSTADSSSTDLVVPMSVANPSVFFTTLTATAYNWQGAFSGTGCVLTYGVAKVPYYALSRTTTGRPAISIAPITQLISAATAPVEVRIFPTPAGGASTAIEFTLKSGTAAAPGSAVVSGSPCSGTFSAATLTLNTGNCASGSPTCAATGSNFSPAGSCTLATASSASVVAELAAAPASLAGYTYYNAANGQLATVPAGGGGQVRVFTITSALSTKIRWRTGAERPTATIVAVGGFIGPFVVEFAGATGTGYTFGGLAATYGGSFQVFASASGLPTISATTGNWLPATQAVTLGNGYLVYYRAPATSSPAMLAAAAADITILTPAGVSYDPEGAPLTLRIRLVPSISTSLAINSAPPVVGGINIWAGNTAGTRTTVTFGWVSPVVGSTNSISIFGTSAAPGSKIAFLPLSATPAQLVEPSGTVTQNTGNREAIFGPNLNDGACTTATPSPCALITISIPAGANNVSFLVLGARPGEVIHFYPMVTGTGSDPATFHYPDSPITAKAYGQVMFNSYPNQLSVLVPTFFGVTVTPPTGSVTGFLTASDDQTNRRGTYSYCSDISCVSPQAYDNTNGFDLTAGFSGTDTVIQYIPPLPTACTGEAVKPYPCLLGTIPTFSFEVDPDFAFAHSPDLANRTVIQKPGKFKITISGNPQLRGSIAVTYMNYEAANGANAPIGSATAMYPLSNDALGSSLPLPMVAGATAVQARPSMNFLAGVRYVIGVTMFPPPAGPGLPSVTVSYAENTVTNNGNFTFNRLDSSAAAPIGGVPPLNASFVNIFGAVAADFDVTSSNFVDGGLRDLPTSFLAKSTMCQPNALAPDSRCFIGFFYWTAPAITSVSTRNPRLVLTVTGPGSNDYPTQTQTVKVSGWCGPSSNLRDPVQPTHYATPTVVNTVCTPALTAGNVNIFNGWSFGSALPRSQPLFFPTANAFVHGTTNFPATTGADNAAGLVVPFSTTGTWYQNFRATVENTAQFGAASDRSVLIYSVTKTVGAPHATRSAIQGDLEPSYIQTRIFSKVVGVYSFRLEGGSSIATNCVLPATPGYIVDPSRLPSVKATSLSRGQVCFYPARVATAGTAYSLAITDNLSVASNLFAAVTLLSGAVPTAFDPAGVAGPATAFLLPGPPVAPTAGALAIGIAAGAVAYDGINFDWSLTNAATNIAQFRVCDNIPAAAGSFTGGVVSTQCAAGFPSFPATDDATPRLEYRPVTTAASVVAVTYTENKVPISVTMKFVARGMPGVAPDNDFKTNGVAAFHFIVGETYAIELRSADLLTSPAQSGLTVSLTDRCGVMDYGLVPAAPAAAHPAVPARGQFSSQTLFFSPGESTKTVFYTPREICAPVVGGTTVNWGTIISASVCTDATNPQCADGAAVRFVDPISVYVYTYGSVRVDNVPAFLPTGVATSSPITVTLNPPIGAPSTVASVSTTATGLTVTVSDRYPTGTTIGTGESAGGSFILNQNTGASATLVFSAAGSAQSASISYVSPINSFFTDANNVHNKKNAGISFVLSGTGASLYRIVSGNGNIYNGLASTLTAAGTGNDVFAAATANAATFNLRIVPEAAAEASIEGVYFNVVGGAALAQSTASSLATVSDNISAFVGNANVLPGQSNNAVNFNLPFVSGVPFGYFAAVPFNMSAVVVNVATTANTVFVNNNGWPNAKSAGGSIGGYILPNALSGYVSPVFFLTPGLNTFLVAAPLGGTVDAFAFGAPAGSKDTNPGANGDGIVYRFTIARDTITNFGLFVSANGHANLPWAANLPRLQAQWVAGGNTPSLLTVAPGSGSTQNVFTANVENAVQSVGILAQFYGALKARVSSNNNEFGQILVNIPNNRLVDFQLVTPTNLPGIMSSTTSITLLGGGLGPITINVVRPGKSLIFGAFAGSATTASNIENRPTGPCVTRTATTFGLAVYPSSRPSRIGLTIRGTYTTGSAAPVPLAQAANSPTTTWDLAPQMSNYLSFATLTAAALPVSTLPLTLNLEAVYPAAPVASEYTSLTNYQLNLCPA